MTRNKVNLVYIANDSARRAEFRKRKGGIMKLTDERSTWCKIEACVVLFSPYDLEPNVWPSQLGAQQVIVRFRNLSPLEQNRRMVNQKSYLMERLKKTKEKLMKQWQKNLDSEMTQLMYQCLYGGGFQHLNIGDLNKMNGLIGQNLREIDRRVEFLQRNNNGESNGEIQ